MLYSYPHVTGEETEAQIGYSLPTVIQLLLCYS